MAIDYSLYSILVNVTDSSEINAVNFLDSLDFRKNAEELLQLIGVLESELASRATLLPSFKSKSLIDENYVELEDEQEMFMECISFQFVEYETSSIFDYLSEHALVTETCSKVVFNKAADSLTIFLLTDRFNQENSNFDGCEFLVIE
jgi:hypothetical protein